MKRETNVSGVPSRRLLCAMLLTLGACGGGGGGGDPVPPPACSITQREAELSAALAVAPSSVDFSFAVERADGRRFVYSRGASTMSTVYESASTSKWVSSVVILRLVEQGYLNLSDRPQDRIPGWPISNSDPLYNATLAQLLSFTSGLNAEPLCVNLPNASFSSCATQVANLNAGNGIAPGTQFHYASSHMQVAGLMAINARGVASWQAVFDEFKAQTGLFAGRDYDLPSITNPRLAGGMRWTGEDYLAFLKALRAGQLLGPTMMGALLQDRTGAGVTIAYSPVTQINEVWHYGLGLWHECQSATWNCQPGTRVSSPGAYGAYPFWDRQHNYIGMLARQGALGSFSGGDIATERSVRPQVEAWAACQ